MSCNKSHAILANLQEYRDYLLLISPIFCDVKKVVSMCGLESYAKIFNAFYDIHDMGDFKERYNRMVIFLNCLKSIKDFEKITSISNIENELLDVNKKIKDLTILNRNAHIVYLLSLR
jgi:hypothetical protein